MVRDHMPKIKIGDAEHDVSDAIAAALKSNEDRVTRLEAETKKAAEEIGRAKAEADAARSAEAEKLRQAEIDKLKGKGEFDKAIDLERQRVRAVADRFRDAELRSLAASHPRLRKAGLDDAARNLLIDDVVSQMRSVATFDLDRQQVQVVVDGKPVDPKTHLDTWLSARPHLLEPSQASGSGADPTKTHVGSPGGIAPATISRSEYDAAAKSGNSGLMKSIAEGKTTITG
jgi:uncharacterized protein YdcH (DUF465 family)